MKRSLLTFMVAVALCVAAGCSSAESGRGTDAAKRPNILLLLADDLGYADVSFNVSGTPEIPTPNLDKLAHAGLIFTSAYVVHPFCGPSRMGMFAGRYPHVFGGPFNLPSWEANAYREHGISTNETLISTVLQNAGYFTGLVGKWHLGEQPQFHPNRRGFDEFYGFLGGGINYFGPYQDQNADGTIWSYRIRPEHNGTPDRSLGAEDYITDVLSDKGVAFLNAAATNDRPFFLFMSYNAPHTPLEAKESDMAAFPNLQGKRKTYAGMVHAMDRGVSNLVAALKANGQFDNTLIIFLSDNGGRTDEGGVNTPLQGGKGDVWDGGFRVPMFWHWPAGLPTGKRYEHPVTALDFYPTFARLAKASIPAGKDLDGKDVLSDLVAGRNARPGESIYSVRYNIDHGANGISTVGIRRDEWKAVKIGGGNWQLFNSSDDLGEKTDLKAKHPEILKEMVSAGKAWSQSHVTPLWYDSKRAGQEWVKRGMPHYDQTFSLP